MSVANTVGPKIKSSRSPAPEVLCDPVADTTGFGGVGTEKSINDELVDSKNENTIIGLRKISVKKF